jgi:hypothetical protein
MLAVRVALAVGAVVLSTVPASASAAPAPPTPRQCAQARADRELPVAEAYEPARGAPRVFAMQPKQDLRNVVTYAAFRRKIECMIRDLVAPRMAAGRPNLVVFNEDIGLMTLATGPRAARARAVFGNATTPGCEGQPAPCDALQALAAITDAYAPQVAAYRGRFGELAGLSGGFVAATDTFARGWMTTFSDLARRYRVYLVGSNTQARFRETRDPAEIAAFADPDVRRPTSAFVATGPEVYNETFLWAPRNVRRGGPAPLRNVVASNRKVPLTPLEEALSFVPGPSTGAAAPANLRPYRIPGTRARLGFATSLPAFTYGDLPAGTDPCSDTSSYYMRCLDRLGANVVIQADANPGSWTGPDGDMVEQWQPLSWMTSTWRAVVDPTVSFAYDVTPMLTGNLADIPFDGQTAITQRGLRGQGCHYVGDARWIAGEDRPDLVDEAGPKPEFLALAPWVARDGPRARLRAVGDALLQGSGSGLSDDYAETAVVADLTFPPDPRRPNCRTGPA